MKHPGKITREPPVGGRPHSFRMGASPVPRQEVGLMSEETRLERGLRTRARIFGEEGEERRQAFAEASPAFAQFVTESVYGDLYARDGIDDKTRETVILSVLCAQGRDREFGYHAKAALRIGMTKEEIQEIILICAIYAGAPNAVGATDESLRVFKEFGV